MDACFIWYLVLAGCLPLVTSLNKDCGEENFPCDSGDQCVERNKWCDKEENCRDGSDETYCKEKGWWAGIDPNNCYEKEATHILCGSGICIPIAAKCDKLKDCDDGYDEQECETTQTLLDKNTSGPTGSAVSIKPSSNTDNREEVTMSSVPKTSTLLSMVTSHHEEDDVVITTPTPREVHLNRINGYFPTSTSYYQKRMKEAESETKPSPTFPKTVPTVVNRLTPPTVQPTSKTYNFSSYRPSSTTPRNVVERHPPPTTSPSRSLSTRSPSYNAQQRRTDDQSTNHYQRPVNHYQLPTYPHQPPHNQYQSPTYPQQSSPNQLQPNTYPHQHHPYQHNFPTHPRQPPHNQYQSPSYPRQPSPNQHPPPTYPHQPPDNQYQSPTYPRQSSSNNHHASAYPHQHYPSSAHPHQPHSNRYQAHIDQHQPLPHASHNQYRPLNGEPDVRHPTNYFKSYDSKAGAKKVFYFAKDYSSIHGRDNELSVSEGIKWLLRQRTDDADWGRNTPRAMIALSLANSRFLQGDSDDEIMKKRFMIRLGTDLLRNNTENFNINRMAMAINGLLAVCEDPTDFHGIDLTEMLRYKIGNGNRRNSYLSPFVFLSLCLSNKSLSSLEVHNLMKQMTNPASTNERIKDMKSAAIMAFSCYIHQSASEDTNYLRSTLREAVNNLLEQIGEDGNFGSVYSTALAAQALMSTNETSNWDSAQTMNFLKQHQHEDGSFGDLPASYFALPALSGRSLLHLRNKRCDSIKRELTPPEILEFVGTKQYVHYSLHFGYPLVNSQSMYLPVPKGINFFDVMRVAEFQDENYRFVLEENSSKVYSLAGLPNDPEMGLAWHLYVKPESSPIAYELKGRERFNGDLKSLLPKSGDHMIFWYHSTELRI